MRPIEYKTDQIFSQALRCVECRIPPVGSMRYSTYIHAVALRYGLIGATASHYLLLSSSDEEEIPIMDSIASWPLAVEEHFRWKVMPRLKVDASPLVPTNLANLAYLPVVSYLDMYRRLCPLEDCLNGAVLSYLRDNIDEIRNGWFWLKYARSFHEFREKARESVHFALMFFERRQAHLAEVPEIALLGE